MSKFFYIVHATTGDNVGELEADTREAALKELKTIYGKPTDLITFELITQAKRDSEAKRIEKARIEEANKVEPPSEE